MVYSVSHCAFVCNLVNENITYQLIRQVIETEEVREPRGKGVVESLFHQPDKYTFISKYLYKYKVLWVINLYSGCATKTEFF